MKKNNDDDISENKFDVNFIQCHCRYCNLKRSTFFFWIGTNSLTSSLEIFATSTSFSSDDLSFARFLYKFADIRCNVSL